MQEITLLQQVAADSKPTARFDKAPIYRKIDDEVIAIATAKNLINVLDEPVKFQTLASRIGRNILSPFDGMHELEQDINKNHVQCGLVILKQLFKHKIIIKRLEEEVIGVNEDGSKRYRLFNKNGKTFKIKHWNIYVSNKSFVEALFYHLPVDSKDRSLPTIFKPKNRIKFFDYEAGPLVTNVNRTYIKRFSKKNVPMIYKHINELQSIEWRINNKVLDAVKANLHQPLFSFSEKLLDAGAKNGLKRDLNCTLALAESLRDKHFYFYWMLAFRGRYYNASTYLSSQGSKLSKSLLLLNKKKRLGKDGLKWLFVQCANCAGQDKLPISERVEWTENHLESVLEVGNNPNDTYTIWSEMDDPTGFLAACVEIAEAHKIENAEDYESGLLVQFDATTSGLQIMAMITRCELVGGLTNLTDSDEAGDVYLAIADHIWDNLSDYWKHKFDKRRKLVKRSVMTIFYSAGINTISDAIYGDFKADLHGLTKELSKELGKAIMKGCKEVLPGAFKVMKLFIEIGSKLADDNKLVYIKGKANDFPFIQSYTLPEIDRLQFKDNGERITLSYISKQSAVIDKNAIITGSSPNIIHHLDSQIVAAVLEQAGYTVAPTHDCFGALAADADSLYDDVRACFYELFGENDVLQDLCDNFKVKNTISYGTLDTKQMLYNQFCFS